MAVLAFRYFSARTFYGLIILVLWAVALAIYANIYFGTRKLRRVLSSKDPDEKIRVIGEYLSANRGMNKSNISGLRAELKVGILNMLAFAYASKDDYTKAFELFDEAAKLFDRLKPVEPDAPKLDVREQNITGRASCLIDTGELTEAWVLLEPFMRRLNKLDFMHRPLVLLRFAILEAKRGNVESARKAVDSMLPDLERFAALRKDPDIHYDGVMIDAIVEKAEGKFDSARAKFEDVIKNCGNVGVVKDARKELEGINI
jgi:tetratricopeptide (TPR) repeat protein